MQLYADRQYQAVPMAAQSVTTSTSSASRLISSCNPAPTSTKLATDLRNIHLRNKADDTDIKYQFLQITRTHLFRSDGTEAGMETVRLFAWIALIVLVIACINYVNLSTARFHAACP